MLEHTFVKLNNSKIARSNEHPATHPDRHEHDFAEREKEHLAVLRAKLHTEIANRLHETLIESAASSDRLGRKITGLNIAMALLTLVLAVSALFELFQ